MYMWQLPILTLLFMPFRFIATKTSNYLAFKPSDFERTWWRLFHIIFDILVKIKLKLNTLYYYTNNQFYD